LPVCISASEVVVRFSCSWATSSLLLLEVMLIPASCSASCSASKFLSSQRLMCGWAQQQVQRQGTQHSSVTAIRQWAAARGARRWGKVFHIPPLLVQHAPACLDILSQFPLAICCPNKTLVQLRLHFHGRIKLQRQLVSLRRHSAEGCLHLHLRRANLRLCRWLYTS
jgi:hypothetical protein